MMKRTISLAVLATLLMLCFTGCALTYSTTKIETSASLFGSPPQVISEYGLFNGLVKLYVSTKPLNVDKCAQAQGQGCQKKQDCAKEKDCEKEQSWKVFDKQQNSQIHGLPKGFQLHPAPFGNFVPNGLPVPNGHPNSKCYVVPAEHTKEKEHTK